MNGADQARSGVDGNGAPPAAAAPDDRRHDAGLKAAPRPLELAEPLVGLSTCAQARAPAELHRGASARPEDPAEETSRKEAEKEKKQSKLQRRLPDRARRTGPSSPSYQTCARWRTRPGNLPAKSARQGLCAPCSSAARIVACHLPARRERRLHLRGLAPGMSRRPRRPSEGSRRSLLIGSLTRKRNAMAIWLGLTTILRPPRQKRMRLKDGSASC